MFRSWDAPKAATYRRLNGLDDAAGTAVTVQTMVFGNAGGASGAGVGFTRDPATGEPRLYFDFCFNGQGEDVVAGRQSLADSDRLRRELPDVHARLEADRGVLEALFRDAQDFEFTVQDGMLYLLQTRAAKRTPWAGLRIAVDMVAEGLISPTRGAGAAGGDRSGLGRAHALRRAAAGAAGARAVVAGIGVACGPIALDAAAAARFAGAGTPAILVRPETVTEDIAGSGAGGRTADRGRQPHRARGGGGAPAWQGVPGRVRRADDRPGAAGLPDRRSGLWPRAT